MTRDSGKRDVILVIRLSAMGDIIHTLPAAASLKKSFPDRKLTWLMARRWMPLLEGNPFIDEVIPFERESLGGVRAAWRRVRALRPELAVDFQGLVQSAMAGRIAQPARLFGFDRSVAREALASFFYTHRIPARGPHRVERNLQLAEAAGARELTCQAWIPEGCAEGELPPGPFVLTNPFAGWPGKEWPLERYAVLGQHLQREGFELVMNVPERRAGRIAKLKHVRLHVSGLRGLIDATRRATAVVGVDSGPLHLAAALRKPGAGLFGPTDPTRTGPFGGSMTVLRAQNIETTYKRHRNVHASMRQITVEEVAEAVLRSIASETAKTTEAIKNLGLAVLRP